MGAKSPTPSPTARGGELPPRAVSSWSPWTPVAAQEGCAARGARGVRGLPSARVGERCGCVRAGDGAGILASSRAISRGLRDGILARRQLGRLGSHAREEPKQEEFIDGVLCEVVYALDKQLRWIEKNIQPGTKRVQARLRAQDLAMKNGDNQRVVEARPVRDPPRPLVNPPARVARGAGPEPWPRHLDTKPRHRLDTSTPHANSTNSTPLDTPRHHLGWDHARPCQGAKLDTSTPLDTPRHRSTPPRHL